MAEQLAPLYCRHWKFERLPRPRLLSEVLEGGLACEDWRASLVSSRHCGPELNREFRSGEISAVRPWQSGGPARRRVCPRLLGELPAHANSFPIYRAMHAARLRCYGGPLSGTSRTGLRRTKTEIGKWRAETAAVKPAAGEPEFEDCRPETSA